MMRLSKLIRLYKNIIDLMSVRLTKELSDKNDKIISLNNQIDSLKYDFVFFKRNIYYQLILNYYNSSPSDDFRDEIDFLKELGHIEAFPYKRLKSLTDVQAFFDPVKQMPYVIHPPNKKLFFPKNWSVVQARENYIKFIQTENLLGGNYLKKSPHQYQSENVFVKENDVVIDVGCSEALFALDVIDIARKVYLIESNAIWLEPLRETFKPYMDKVEIINKAISNTEDQSRISLNSLLKDEDYSQLFIKMDIEGDELNVIENSRLILRSNRDVRISCCTYHRHDDAQKINAVLEELGYKTEFSEGYMLFFYDNDLKPPWFRKGLIRAWRQ